MFVQSATAFLNSTLSSSVKGVHPCAKAQACASSILFLSYSFILYIKEKLFCFDLVNN